MYRDCRLNPNGKWYFEKPEDADLRLPDYIKSVVCFLCVEDKSRTIYGGTAFFVDFVSETHPEIRFTYLVTAKHCVTQAYEVYGHLKARINVKDGASAATIELPNKWEYSEDPSVDVAVLFFPNVPSEFDVLCIDSRFIATDDQIEKFGVGIGDEVVMVGLFTQHHGKKRNIPVVRSGIIAAMPDERLFDNKTGAEFDAYLVEVRSIGGLSGSPVFAALPPHRSQGLNVNRKDGYCMPIGLIRGHWDMSLDVSLDDFVNEGKINMGIASVTPIQETTKIIMGNETLRKARMDMERRVIHEQRLTEDSEFNGAEERGIS